MQSKAKKLSSLLGPDFAKALKGQPDPKIERLAIDSRRVTPGSLFFALPGLRSDGNSFVDEAISRGAVAVISSQPRRFRSGKVAYVTVENPRLALASVSRAFFGNPDQTLSLIGITGTNGKTTVAYLVKQILSNIGHRYGCLGTIGYDLVRRTVPSFRTTPEALDLCDLLAQMREFECRGAVMEVSSHGIDQHRVSGMNFEVAAFLNLTRDHLDYHQDMQSYYEVKRRLFNGENGTLPKVAVVNVDDEYGARLVSEIPEQVEVLTYGESADAMFRAEIVELSSEGSHFTLKTQDGAFAVHTPLVGDYNVSNVAAALAVCHGLGLNLENCIKDLDSFPGIPGRMQKVEAGQAATILVDYAHTGDALENALGMLRKVTKGRLCVVFGCGGDRDKGKRPVMTRIANELADYAWATSDNPRNEKIEAIFEDMKEGLVAPDRVQFVPDRRRAIERAIEFCGEGDCLLIAGKGHESFQEYGETVVPFDDRKVAIELVENMRLGGRA
ncbi:UDP-N-acetylmuramoyl-L-alanyl-D-glutamate--2,6-diaminopimelate ligase [Pelagicoccus mobilis]|uniref:UDP-N-acetylmuramoyl-L-alanyl-D-glutamate--2,6-diaminopimelate ligase n=1 Tax=Pelagicoccus mobilis TaxID=415221 RepID=A0A934RW62_9BACT|nr:UDP-N-acetylmuramoyl-L-alanyl-D-glutamate--2,6-diaminopimelate ligase [Pelagicoccus mobilis]MBK1876585.1 UDP-N-acetylmuramoyl-L-alanyl-D-glutamate--2,6-diaminopimelate ligase [Pelagicoccus mobilis]